MAIGNVKSFFEKAEQDESLLKQLQALAKRRGAPDEAAVAELVKIAAGAGYPFSPEEFAEARKQGSRELSEDEMKAVAGGKAGGLGKICFTEAPPHHCSFF